MTGILGEIIRRLIGSEIESSVALAKIEAAIVSLNILKGARRVTMVFCLLVVSVVMLACGFLLIPVALLLLMPWNPETKTIVAASFGAAYILIPVIAVLVFSSEKRWMKASGVEKLVKEALKQ
jgi:hypothetical protein